MDTQGLMWEACSRIGHLYTWSPATVIVVSWLPWLGPYLQTKVPITSPAGRFDTLERAIQDMDPFQNGTHTTWPMWCVPRQIDRYAQHMEDVGESLPCDWAIGCKCYGCNSAFLATLEFWGEWEPGHNHDDGRI